ncbi:MAG: cold-shock protein [Ancalomicrobiaceae bacterium]|nr:cold-shock protein [Ancalomicrobiaceae bacterium]
MVRDKGLEQLVWDCLGEEAGLSHKSMFGGLAWMHRGNLLCGARTDGLLARLGAGNDGWALAIPGVERMLSGGRPMAGWVRASADSCDEDLVKRLLDASLAFVRTLPAK